ncbi:3-octaprenyl-4-hydroxybenzoate carboxy-lyase [Streptomyces glaucescens]
MLPEGPFGDHTGFYTPQEPFPALTIDCVTMRKRPLLQSIVVGRPPTEDGPLGRATERFFLPLLKIIVPDIVDYHLPEAGGFDNPAIVSIHKYPKHAQKVMHAIWGAHMMSLTKLIVVVDSDCDVHDLHEVAWRALGNTDYARDLTRRRRPRRPPGPRLLPAVLGRQGGHRRHPEVPDGGLHPRRRLAGHGRVRPADRGEGRPPLEGVRAVSSGTASAARREPGRTKSFLRLVMIEHSIFALPFAYIAALTAMFQLDRHIHWGKLPLVTLAWSACAPSPWPPTGSSTARSTRVTRARRHREPATGAMSVKHAWTGALVAQRSSWAPPPCSTRSPAGAARGRPMVATPTASGSRTSRTRSWGSRRPSGRSARGSR